MVVAENKREYLIGLMERLTFPADAQKDLLDAFDCILSNATAADRFLAVLQQYEETEQCPYLEMIEQIKALSAEWNIHEYTALLLMYLCMTDKLYSRYLERGIAENIYWDTMMDLRYKLEECRLVHGVNGTFVAHWFGGFFALTRFGLGRLQFELVATKADFTVNNTLLPMGSKAINVHIPRTGTKLDHNDVLAAYKMAAEWFAYAFEEQPVVFTCYSWLLDPWILTVLTPSSNLAAFCRDFKVVETGNYVGYSELWRLFDCKCSEDTAKMPADSSLRRAYIARVNRGEPISWGRGFFVYRDNIIYNH